MLWHHIDRHSHGPSPIDCLLKKFNSDLKTSATKKIDTPIPKLYEDLKLEYAARLSQSDRHLFLTKLPAQKNCMQRAYRARASEFGPLPTGLHDVKIADRYLSTLFDDPKQPLYRGKTDDDCHLFMSTTQCELLRSNF